MMVVMYRDVPTKTGVREILVDEKSVEELQKKGWILKSQGFSKKNKKKR